MVTCPFCGLACDDIEVTDAAINTRGCGVARAGFDRATRAARKPHAIAGRSATIETAVAEAARILQRARSPLFYGLDADVHGVRALLALAERAGGVIDHARSGHALANSAVARTSGWVTATFAEVANRADFVLLVGSDPDRHFPRFRERILSNKAPLYRERPPVVGYLGPAEDAPAHSDRAATGIVERASLLPALSALSVLLLGREPDAPDRDLPLGTLRAVADRLQGARYGSIVWDLTSFEPEIAEHAVESIAAILRRLNVQTRSVGLPLGGSFNVLGAMQAALWQSGWPLRLSFADGTPRHEPWQHNGRRILAQGEADVLVWVSAIAGEPPPSPAESVIAIVSDATELPPGAAVEIRVGVPGVHHAGEAVRADTVIAMPLQAPRPSNLPSVADVARAILAKLEAGA